MSAKLAPLLVAAGLLAACTTPPAVPTNLVAPEQAVVAAAKASPGGIEADFGLTVQGADWVDGKAYLDSRPDYRDPIDLSVEILPTAAAVLKVKYGEDPVKFFKGKRIAVHGVARKVQVDFIVNGRLTGDYYFQTHVQVTDASQIRILP